MQRTALYNRRKTEAQLKSENNFTVEGEMLKKYFPKMYAFKNKKQKQKNLPLLTKGKI